ncbi:MAG: hypothetical protein JW894_10705 [Bacteroidales bacterium]|nr:hypothetical protein [Bacteroidales bacterium]
MFSCRNNIRTDILILLNCLLSISVFSNYRKFENYSPENGLSHSHVLSFLEDSKGFMWIGTFDGVCLFDGYTFRQYKGSYGDSASLSNNCIYKIFEDSKGYIWFGTENGLNKYNLKTGKFTVYTHNPSDPTSLPHNHIRDIYEDSEGMFWLATFGGGICRFNPSTGKSTRFNMETHPSGLLSNKINILYVDSKGLFWLGTDGGGISIFDPLKENFIRQFTPVENKNSMEDWTINTIYEDKYGTFWIGTWHGGLNHYNPKADTWNNYMHDNNDPNTIPGNTVRSIVQDDVQNLWVATYGGGLCKFNTVTEKATTIYIDLNIPNNFSQTFLWILHKDTKDNLWIGSFGAGFYKLNKKKSTFPYFYVKKDEEDADKMWGISCLFEDNSGTLWLGTLGGGLYNFDYKTNTTKLFYKDDDIFKNLIRSIHEDSEKRLWLGTDYGLFRISKDRKTIDYFKPGDGEGQLNNNAIFSIYQLHNGDLWLGLWGVGINVLPARELGKNPAEARFKKYLHNPEDLSTVAHNVVWDIMEDSRGDIWVGTSYYLNRFNPLTESFIPFRNCLTIANILEDEEGNLWVGSLSAGLYVLNNKREIEFRLGENDESYASINSLLEDNSGNIWMSAQNGLVRINKKNKEIKVFTQEYGLQAKSFAINVAANLQSGKLAFGGTNGFNIFHPDSIEDKSNPPPIIITDFKIFNQSVVKEITRDKHALIQKPLYYLDSVQLTHRQNIFTIEFASPDYSNPYNIRYAYKLEGFNKDWTETNSKNRSVTYTNLRGGEYIFKVRSTDVSGNWYNNTKELKIIITPPYWQTLWFRLAVISGITLTVFLIFRIRMQQFKQRMQLNQEHVIVEKLRRDFEIVSMQNEQLKEDIDKKNKKIASQALKQVANNEKLETILGNILELKNKYKNTRLQQDLNILQYDIEKEIANGSTRVEFNENINLLYDNFIERFAKEHPKLTHKDLKICAYIRMNKSNKEIARLLNITSGSLEISRYRIRKKLSLTLGTNLNDYILRF